MPWRERSPDDFDDEIRAHLEAEEAALIAEGASPEAACMQARKSFGNVLLSRERFYEKRRFRLFSTFFADLRQGMRQLRLNPGFAVLAIATMAIAIGATTALFSVVYAVLLKPLPYADPDRLARVWMDNRRLQMREDWASWANYQDYKSMGTSMESMSAFSNAGANIIGDGEPERLAGVRAEASLFDLLGVKPVAGRFFTKEEETDGKNAVWVIGYGLWHRRFGGRADVIGQKVQLDGSVVTVIGVAPPEFRFPMKTTEYWTPLVVGERAKGRVGYWLQMVGKRRANVSWDQAQTQMTLVGKQLEQQYPKENAGYGIFVNPLENHIAGETRQPLLILLGAVGFVLLIACVNVAGLMLARSETRGREVALRSALGAGSGRLVLMTLAESSALGIFAGIAGIAVAWAGIKLLIASAPREFPRLDEISLSWPVLLFAFGATLATAVLSGLAPALRLARMNLNQTLREGGRGAAGSRGAERMRAALVVGECMLAIMLLAGAGLLIRSLANLRAVDPGFRTDGILSMNVGASRGRASNGEQMIEHYRQILERLRSTPGVAGASAVSSLMLSETPNSGNFTLEDRPPFPEEEQIEATLDAVSPGFFRMMGVPLVYGSYFEERLGPDSPRVAIVNHTFAQRYWPGRDPVGKKFTFGVPNERTRWITIVGVVKDMHRRGLHRPARLETFFSTDQMPRNNFQILVAAANGDALSLAPVVRGEIRALDPSGPITQVETVAANLGESLAARRFQTMLLTLFAALALLLAAVGIFALLFQTVRRRTQEIGVRMALGARRGDVVALVVRRGMALIVAGGVLGIAGAAAIGKLLGGMLFGVQHLDGVSYGCAAAALCALGFVACWLPAHLAARVDPLVALRHD